MKSQIYTLQILALLLALLGCKKDNCEAVNLIANSSFEMVSSEDFPLNWEYCGFQNTETPVSEEEEIYSNSEFLKEQSASDGENYIVLIATDNNTWEMISQELNSNLKQNEIYELELACARQANYVGYSINTQMNVNYTSPIKFQIWGGSSGCEKDKLLYSSELIINTRWLKYKIEFTPTQDFSHLIIEAGYKTPVLFPYNGNIMIDEVELFKVD